MTQHSDVAINLKVSSNSVVHGCAGVPRSIPRIDTVAELRPINGQPFHLRGVSVELRMIQKISIPNKIGSSETFREYKIFEDSIFRPTVGSFSEELLGVDIPILFHLPRDIASSGMFPSWPASTTYRLVVRALLGDFYSLETTRVETFPVVIKVYDTLPLYRQFNEPLIEQYASSDNQVIANVTMPVSCVGPRDPFVVDIHVLANPSNNKLSRSLRLKLLTLQIREILECHEGGLTPKRDVKIFTQTKDYNASPDRLTTQGVNWKFEVPFPVENDSLGRYSAESGLRDSAGSSSSGNGVSIAKIVKYNTMDKLDEGVPLTHIQGFTSTGKLFLVRFEIALKIKLAHSKDIETRTQVAVCPFNRSSCEYLFQWIKKECDAATAMFGKEAVSYIAMNESRANEVLRQFMKPPRLYRNDRNGWTSLGYNRDAFGKGSNSNMVEYID